MRSVLAIEAGHRFERLAEELANDSRRVRCSMSENDGVIYRPDAHRFEYVLGEHVAVCDYVDRGDTWVFNHTYVPPAFRGQGVAAKLARAGLELARARGKKVIPTCSYIAKYIETTPEFRDLLSASP